MAGGAPAPDGSAGKSPTTAARSRGSGRQAEGHLLPPTNPRRPPAECVALRPQNRPALADLWTTIGYSAGIRDGADLVDEGLPLVAVVLPRSAVVADNDRGLRPGEHRKLDSVPVLRLAFRRDL
jgi:hypothetical protein